MKNEHTIDSVKHQPIAIIAPIDFKLEDASQLMQNFNEILKLDGRYEAVVVLQSSDIKSEDIVNFRFELLSDWIDNKFKTNNEK